MRKASLQTFTLILGAGVASCTALPDDTPGNPGVGGTAGAASGGTSGAAIGGGTTGGTAGSASATGGSTTGGTSTGGSATGGAGAGGAGTGGNATGGAMGGSGGSGGAIGGTGGAMGGNATGGAMGGRGGAMGGNATGGAMGGKGGSAMGGAGAGGKSGGGGAGGASGGAGSGGATQAPDCNAQMPSGGTQRSGNGTGGTGNLAWEIWSNTGQGNLTTFSVPAFVATWNNSGGYLGRLGYEWGRFGDTPVPHTQRGTITAQFVSRKTGTAGGYSYIGMYGWTTNPCVEWYVVEDNFGTLPFNPGGTTNRGEVTIDGGTYIIYLRPTTGTGGSRCSGVNSWNQYYSMRRTARACGVISLTQHFNAWQAAGLDMSGALLEAKILVEVGGGVGNVQLPIANVILQ